MPAAWFDEELRQEPLSLDTVSAAAEVAGVSLTAAAFRCVELEVFPCTLVFCRNGEIRWYKISDSFPHSYVPHGDAPHPYTGAGEYFTNGHTSTEPEPTPCNAWFLEDGIPAGAKVFEQCQPMYHLNATLSLIWRA